MNFIKMDAQTWERREMFYYFTKMAPTGYSITNEVDVTAFYRTVKSHGYKFFPAYLWVVTKNLCRQKEFTTAVKDGQLGYYDTLTPLYAAFHGDDKTFSLMWTPFTDSFPEFFKNYLENRQKYGEHHGVLSNPEALPPENAYTVSCLPWISFQHFAVHSYENKPYYFPSVEAGKYYMKDGKRMMPLSLTCHHATTDGYHIARFLEDLQKDMDNFEKYC